VQLELNGVRPFLPLRLVLDELSNICPLPRVVEYISDGGGRGTRIVW